MLAPVVGPGILELAASFGIKRDSMIHWDGFIGLVVEAPRHRSNSTAWNELLDEDHGAAVGGVRRATADVEPEIHLLERTVTRNWNPPQPRVDEVKAHETDDVRAAPRIQLRTARDEWFQEARRAIEVEENEMLPTSCQKGRPDLRVARSNGSRFCCASNLPTASAAREPDVYRDCSNRKSSIRGSEVTES